MDRKDRELIRKIYENCLRLQLQGKLSEYDDGRMAVCEMILKLNTIKKLKARVFKTR
jgi:hypothetical protein